MAADAARVRALPLDPEGRTWTRLDGPGGAEAWLIGWPPGAETGWHDHGGSYGVFVTAAGELTEHSLGRAAARRGLALAGTGRRPGPAPRAARGRGPRLRPRPPAPGRQRLRVLARGVRARLLPAAAADPPLQPQGAAPSAWSWSNTPRSGDGGPRGRVPSTPIWPPYAPGRTGSPPARRPPPPGTARCSSTSATPRCATATAPCPARWSSSATSWSGGSTRPATTASPQATGHGLHVVVFCNEGYASSLRRRLPAGIRPVPGHRPGGRFSVMAGRRAARRAARRHGDPARAAGGALSGGRAADAARAWAIRDAVCATGSPACRGAANGGRIARKFRAPVPHGRVPHAKFLAMPRGRHRHSQSLHRMLPPLTVAGTAAALAAASLFSGDTGLLRVLLAATAVAAVVGAGLARTLGPVRRPESRRADHAAHPRRMAGRRADRRAGDRPGGVQGDPRPAGEEAARQAVRTGPAAHRARRPAAAVRRPPRASGRGRSRRGGSRRTARPRRRRSRSARARPPVGPGGLPQGRRGAAEPGAQRGAAAGAADRGGGAAARGRGARRAPGQARGRRGRARAARARAAARARGHRGGGAALRAAAARLHRAAGAPRGRRLRLLRYAEARLGPPRRAEHGHAASEVTT